MPENLNLRVFVHVHGNCIVCSAKLDLEKPNVEISLMKRSGHFPRFMPDGSVNISDTSLLWLHAFHLQ